MNMKKKRRNENVLVARVVFGSLETSGWGWIRGAASVSVSAGEEDGWDWGGRVWIRPVMKARRSDPWSRILLRLRVSLLFSAIIHNSSLAHCESLKRRLTSKEITPSPSRKLQLPFLKG